MPEPSSPLPDLDISGSRSSPRPQSQPEDPPFIPPEDWKLLENFRLELEKYRMEYCGRCKEKWFEMRLKVHRRWPEAICHRCWNKDQKVQDGDDFFFSAANNMDPGAIPSSLPALSQVEEMVIARAHVQMVMKRVRGHQYHYSGHCVSFMQNNIKLFDALPLMPEDLDMVLLRPKDANKNDPRYHRQFQRDFRVRRSAVFAWLRFLKANHPDYRHITIRTDRYNDLPEDGDVSDRVPLILEDEPESPGGETDEEAIPENLDPLEDDDLVRCPVTESMIPNLNVHDSELDFIRRAFEASGPNSTPEQSVPVQQAPVPSAVPAPSFRSTPLDEGASVRLFASAFPTLFPYGVADFWDCRRRSVSLQDWAAHLLRYHDGRFGRHPRFRFLVFNVMMRARARRSAKYFVDKNSNLAGLSREELEMELQNKNDLLPKIVRMGSSLSGTRPFWKSKLNGLEAQARFLDSSPVFLTFSCADMQWDDLHRHLPRYDEYLAGDDTTRKKIVWENVQNEPHIIAHWLYLRFQTFVDTVIQPYLKTSDYWLRFEWQARGTGHIHCLFWIETAPKMDMSTPESRDEFAKYWSERVTAINPDPTRLPDLRNPASLPFSDVENTADQFAAFLNRFQQHGVCQPGKCLRLNKKTGEMECRYWFPRHCFEEAVCTKDINRKSWLFGPARNQSRLNQCCPLFPFSWKANTDFSPPCTLRGVLDYITKYVSKAEKKSQAYKELQAEVGNRSRNRPSKC
jgi:Helitron helicase-like domain at N-terminus